MKNFLSEKPTETLHGRLLASVNFVDDVDIKNKNVLDIGCGYGGFELNALKKDVKEIVGIEISTEDLKTARDNIKDRRAVFKVGEALKLPFKDNCFDTVVSWEVIEHIPKNSEWKMFNEVYRVLKPSGKFYLSTPNNSFFANILDPAWWLIGHRHYSFKDLTKFSNKSNFKLVDQKIVGSWWTLLSIIDFYLSKWILRRSKVFSDFIDKKEDKEILLSGFVNVFLKLKKI